jgi:hypothetical protein
MDSGSGGLGVQGCELELSIRVVAEDKGYPAIAKMAISVVEDDGFGLWERDHKDQMRDTQAQAEKLIFFTGFFAILSLMPC